MSWDSIDTDNKEAVSKLKEEQRMKALEIAKAYSACFSTSEGKKVLEDLTTRFIYNNDTPFCSQNINYESAYHNGEAGVVKFLINQMKQAEII